MSVRVRVDPELCVGTGDCWRLAPTAFAEDKTRNVSAVQPGAVDVDRDLLDEAAFNCPTRAITVEDEG